MYNSLIVTAVGIDVSKGKSVVAIRRPGGEIVMPPFEVKHNVSELKNLVNILRQVDGEMNCYGTHR